MKVKVNGAWVDVPAFKVVEKTGGNIKCLDGDITLASEQNNIVVTHNLGKVAFFATIKYADTYEVEAYKPYYAVVYNDEMGGFGVGEIYKNATEKDGSAVPVGDTNYSPHNTESYIRFWSGNSSRRFLAGNYHYKIYYEV